MANRILTSSTYHDEIRGRLGVDSGTLPDPSIDAPSVLTIGEARVISRVPDYASLTGDDATYLYAAAIAMVAAILAPGMKALIKQQEGDSDYKVTRATVDWSARASELEDEAYSMIDYISTQAIVELPQMASAGPTRAAQAQQTANNGGQPVVLSPSDGDIGLYPTNVE